MRRWAALFLIAALSLFGLVAPSVANAADGPSIVSDQPDYAPGSPVTLTGAGWTAGDTVHVTVNDNDGQTWSYGADATADGDGGFTLTLVLPDWFVATYKVVATDTTNGTDTATDTFTDGNYKAAASSGAVVLNVSVSYLLYNGNPKSTDCSTAPSSSGSQTTPWATGQGVNSGASIKLTAPTPIVQGGHQYSFLSWDAGTASGTSSTCLAGSAGGGTTTATASYHDDGLVTQSQTITFVQPLDHVYGSGSFAVNPTSDSGLSVTVVSNDTTVCTVASASPNPGYTVTLVKVGTCSLTASQAGNASYDPATPVTRTFQITPGTIHATVTGSQTYGGTPSFNQTNDAPGAVTVSGAVTCATTDGGAIDASLAAGSYTIVGTSCSGLISSDTNYNFAYTGGAFTVNPAPIDVTFTGTSVYGSTPSFAGTVLPPGTTGTPTCTQTNGALTIDSSLPQGSYTVDVTSCSGVTATDTNHTINKIAGTYTVTAQDLSVLVSGSQTYGDASASFSGAIASIPNVSFDDTGLACTTVDGGTTIDGSLPVAGPHVIDGSSCTGGSLTGSAAHNYQIGSYVGDAFTVSPAPLTISVSGTQTYGDSPVWHIDGYSGFVLSQDDSVVSGTLTCSPSDPMTHVADSPVAITGCTGLSADNYDISYDPGTIVISKRSIDVSVSGTQVYGSSPTFTPDFGTFVNGDDDSVFTGTLVCDPNVATLHVSQSPQQLSNCSGLTADDYTPNYIPGSLTITPAALTVGVTGSQTYGGTDVMFSPDFTSSTFANGDMSDVFTGQTVTCTAPAGETDGVSGTYTIDGTTCTGLDDSDYDITYDGGAFTVNQKQITVVVNGSQTYGGTNLTYVLDDSGVSWVGSDTKNVLTDQNTCTNTATPSSPVIGSYTVNDCSFTADNYDVTVLPGTFTINKAALNVTSQDKTIAYGDPVPTTLTAVVGPFAVAADSSLIGASQKASCTAPTYSVGSVPGMYQVVCTQGSLPNLANYTYNFVNTGQLTVTTKHAILGFTGQQFWSTGSANGTSANVTLQGKITPDASGTPDLTKATIVFELFSSTNMTSTPDKTCPVTPPGGYVTANAAGTFTCSLTLGLDSWTVVMVLVAPGTTYFDADPSDPAVVTVYQPATDKFATGGGWVLDGGLHGNLGFTVRYDKKGGPSGQSVYTWRGTDGYDYVVKSNSWNGGSLAFTTPTSPAGIVGTVGFNAKANVTVINRDTGAVVSSIGNCSFRVDAVDYGSTDTYAISVYNSAGQLIHKAATSSGGQLTLQGGNIVVHGK